MDQKLSAKLDYTTPATNAAAAWQSGWDGSAIGVAVIDTGVSPGQDFGPLIVYSQDFTGGNGHDSYGHGTQVAGTIAGNGRISMDSSGIAGCTAICGTERPTDQAAIWGISTIWGTPQQRDGYFHNDQRRESLVHRTNSSL